YGSCGRGDAAMVLSFDDALRAMLRGALIGQAHVRGDIQIEQDAANFFVERALNNIKESAPRSIRAAYSAALIAVINAPQFLMTMVQQSGTRDFDSRGDAENAIRAIRCEFVYPWCTYEP